MNDPLALIQMSESRDFDHIVSVDDYNSDDVLKYWRYYRLVESLPLSRLQTPNKLLVDSTNLLDLTPFVESHRKQYDTIWKKQFDRLFNDTAEQVTLQIYTNCLGQSCRIVQRMGRFISHGHEEPIVTKV